jgi:MoaE-MoaD fusion protein
MTVRLIFFAAAAERAQTRIRDIELVDGSRIAHLGSYVVDEYPALADLELVYAVNQQYVSPNQLLNDGDEVAVFTPLSGG